MPDPADAPRPPDVPAPPALAPVQSPPPEELLDSLPSKEQIVDAARPAEAIAGEQPSVDEVLGPDR